MVCGVCVCGVCVCVCVFGTHSAFAMASASNFALTGDEGEGEEEGE